MDDDDSWLRWNDGFIPMSAKSYVSNQHIMVREDGKVHMETTFVSSLFKGLSNRDAAAIEEDKFLIKRSKQMLSYDMVTQLHLFIIIKTQLLFPICNDEVNCVKLII
jgi:hypothetical protein